MASFDIAKESAEGSLILFFGNLVSTIIVAGAAVVIARLLGPGGYGLYTLAYLIPGIIQNFVGLGVNLSVTRYSALYLSKGERGKAVSMTRHAVAFLLLFGVALALLSFYIGPFLAPRVLNRTGLSLLIQFASLTILGSTLAQASTSAFVGWGSMKEASLFSILQASVKLGVSPALILLGFGVYGAVVGNATSYLIQGGAAVGALWAFKLIGAEGTNSSFLSDVREMLAYGLPLYAGSVITGLASQFLTIVLAAIASNTVIGFYQAAVNVTVAITVISSATGNALFRSFATLDGIKGDVNLAFRYSVKYVSLILTPIAFFLFASSDALYGFLYGPFYTSGVVLLKLLAVSYLPVAVGLTVIPSYLNGIGRSGLSMLASLAGAIALVICCPLFAILLGLGANGVVYAILFSNVVLCIVGLFVAARYLNATLELLPLGGIVAASLLACAFVVVIPSSGVPSLLALIADAVVFLFVYLSSAPFLRAVDTSDLRRLGEAVARMGFIGRILGLLLRYEGYLLRSADRGRATLA